MGDPKSPKKKYSTPRHPWIRGKIEEEKILLKEYGLKKKKEIWKMESVLKKFKDQAKSLITARSAQAEKEREDLLRKLKSYALISETAGLDEILGLTLRDILERRLQTQIYKKNLGRTMEQSRQFIVHQHIMVGEKKMTAPSYLVSIAEESLLRFAPSSTFVDPEHPERMQKQDIEKQEVKKQEEKKRQERPKQRDGRRQGKRRPEQRRQNKEAPKKEEPKKDVKKEAPKKEEAPKK